MKKVKLVNSCLVNVESEPCFGCVENKPYLVKISADIIRGSLNCMMF